MATSKARSQAPKEVVWERFEEAVYEYAQQCTSMELEREGDVGPPGGVPWAYVYMEAFFENFFYGDVLADLRGLDGDYVPEEAQYRLVVTFRDGWRAASSRLSNKEVG